MPKKKMTKFVAPFLNGIGQLVDEIATKLKNANRKSKLQSNT
jgi:hypothetical protein